MKRFLAILLLAAMISLVGCSTGQNGGNSQKNENTFTFTDALNREITISKNPKRTAALIGSFADVWQISGGEICASVDDAWDDFGLDLPDAVNLGGAHSPSFEALLSANPDFVIASASTAADVEMKEQLDNAGITVAYFDVDNFDDYLKMLDICTEITGRKDLYKQNGLDVKTKIDEIKSDFAAKNLSEKERTVLILRASSGFVKAKGSEGTILGEILADLGCKNIADSDKSLLENLSVESVIRSEPYRIFVVTMGNDTDAALDNLKRMIEENPAWGQLGAVKENRLHIMEKRLFNIKPNEEWAVAYEKLAKILSGEN